MKLKLGTESLAKSAARRPKTTIAIWLIAVVVAFALIGALLSKGLTNEVRSTNNPESSQADTLLKDRLNSTKDTQDEMVIVRSSTLTIDDPQYRSHVEELFSNLIALGDTVVKGGVNYYMTGDKTLVSADRHSTLIPLTMPKDADKVVDKVYAVADKSAVGPFEVFLTGNPSFSADSNKVAEATMKTGESVGITVALVVLALVFGALAAALLPITLGIVAVIGALGLTALVGQAMQLTFSVTNMITMMGLAVGIDYSLFIVTRFREERRKGLAKIDAIAATGATASRAVLFSGMTVILALTGMVIFPLSIFQSMGIGAILVVAMAILASLTLLPAVLSLLGDKVNAIRIPFIQGRRKTSASTDNSNSFWAHTTRLVTRRPIISLVLAAGLLAVVAIPYFGKHTGMSGISGLPDDLRAKQGFMVLQKEFGYGTDSHATVVVDGHTDSQAIQSAIGQLKSAMGAEPVFVTPHVQVYPQADLTTLSARMAGDPMTQQAMDAVARLRSDMIPSAFGASQAKVYVTGDSAYMLDFNQTTNTYTPIIFAFVLSLSFVLLTVAFRSVVIPATAILMNLLSVGAAYGMIVLVFQKGFGHTLLGFQQVDAIETWLPLFLFAVLFGLSMDYHVFLLSRIRERFNQTGDNSEAVSFGLRSTGSIITGAALIMVAVFGGFALGDMVMFQQMGFGLAVAVLLDATIVRSILVPATMTILGKVNWYLPKWLDWVPNVSLGEGASIPAKPARESTKPGFSPKQPMPTTLAVQVQELELPSQWKGAGMS